MQESVGFVPKNTYICSVMGERDYLELLELQNRIKEGIADAFPGRYWVKAEISSWSPRANGHCYLTLSQSRAGKSIAESRAMIWKWNFPQLRQSFESATGQQLQAGITVLVRVQVSFSELYGISLFIDDIDPAFTLGEKALERKRAIERLQKDGYMEMQQELALPDLPRKLAIITSKTAAGYQDFRNHLINNPEAYAFTLDLFEALMQGEQAPDSIIEALQDASKADYDAILILRGGGSELDLACFDDYALAIAIATCPVPVVTAIGHDKDVHIADMVAHASVKTPTALADFFLEFFRTQDAALDSLRSRISAAAKRLVSKAELHLEGTDSAIGRSIQRRIAGMQQAYMALAGRIRLGLNRKFSGESQKAQNLSGTIRLGLNRRLAASEQGVQRCHGRIVRGLAQKWAALQRQADGNLHRIKFAAQARVGTEVSRVALKEAVITGSDPRKILGLGYVLVTGKDNKVLKTVDRVSVGDRIGVRFKDGSITARVDQVYSETVDNDKVNIA